MNALDVASKTATVVIGAILFCAAAELAEDLMVPILAAFVVGIIMSPITDRLGSMGLRPSVGALLSLAIILLVIAALALLLEPVVYRAIDAAPQVMDEVNRLVSRLRWEFRGIEDISDKVSEAIGDNAASNGDGGGEANAAVQSLPSVSEAIFMAPAIVSQIMIFAGVLFFFILTKAEIYAFVAKRLVSPDRRAEAVARLRDAERQVGNYFLTISVINASYAVIVTLVMMAIGLPSPLLWGIAAGLLNFVLYLGPVAMVGALLLAGILVFEGSYSFLPAMAYLAINVIEAQFVTPALIGRAMNVNPLLIFVSLVFLLWLWGPIGGIIAIPLLLWVTVLSVGVQAVRAGDGQQSPMEP